MVNAIMTQIAANKAIETFNNGKNIAVERYKKTPPKVRNYVIGGFAAILSFFIARHFYKKWRKTKALKELGNSEVTQQATALYSAFNPSGFSWLKAFDTTNTAAIMNVAAGIKDYESVAKIYKKIYNSELTIDLQNELSQTEYQSFLDILNKAKSGQITQQKMNENETPTSSLMRVRVIASEVKMYKDPYWAGTPFAHFKTAPYEAILYGYTTGKIKNIGTFLKYNMLEVKMIVGVTNKVFDYKLAYVENEKVELIDQNAPYEKSKFFIIQKAEW